MSSQAGTGTSEVSKKLKAAIRAKLEELGVYVDDELPDYIMVMIANKKEKVQMKDDLNLFIGKSTAKFVDWLFDLFDRLQNASNKQGETSKKDEDVKKEQEAKEQEERRREEKEERDKELQKEKDREHEREREREREREKERQRERDRAKRVEEEKRREEKRKDVQRNKRRRSRSRSNTYSDDERVTQNVRHHNRDRRARSGERRQPANRLASASPEKKLQSTVVVKRNIRPTGDANVRGRGTMFLRAMNEASVSAGYGSSKVDTSEDTPRDDDMSDVEALPSKTNSSPKKSLRDRLSRVNKGVIEPIDDDAVVLKNQTQSGGPQMILKLSGGKEAIKKTRIQDRIVVDDSLRKGLLKRRIEVPEVSEEPKSKHERIVFDVSHSRDSTPTDDSPTMQKWDGQIKIGDSDSDDEEAEIDAFVAEARGIARKDSVLEEDELPPTHQLSGATYAVHIPPGYPSNVPTYIPTPLSVLNEQHNQMGAGKDPHMKERCVFWPKCTKGEACAFMHPTTNCKNFPNCTYGIRCLFIHPACRFDRFCTKKHCPYTHHGTGGVQPGVAPELKNPLTSNRVLPSEELPKPAVRGTLGSLAEKLAASIKKKAPSVSTEQKEGEAEVRSDENGAGDSEDTTELTKNKPDSPTTSSIVKGVSELSTVNAPLQSMIHCRYAGGCRNPVCHFKHPKECRFGANCRNPSCYFYHKPGSTSTAPASAPISTEAGAAKYKWTAAN